MPIHDQGYRRYTGRKRAVGSAWWVIARTGILAALSQRRFLGLLLLALAPFLVRAVQIYVSANFQQASFLAANAEMFREFLSQQAVFVFFITIHVGAGLIADDRRANALQIYLSRPLTQAEYIVGKVLVLLPFLLGVTWLPAMLLLLLQVLFAGPAFLREHIYLVPAITLLSFLEACASAFAMLALSSLSRSRRFVSVMYAGIVFFTAALSTAVRGATGRASLSWLSPATSLGIVGDAIFRLNVPRDMPVGAALLSVVVLIVGSLLVLHRRVRPVEVVT